MDPRCEKCGKNNAYSGYCLPCTDKAARAGLEKKYRQALRLLKDARRCLIDELAAMDEEEQSQPIPKAHGRVADRIGKFLGS